MMTPSILREVQRLGHRVFAAEPYDLNLIVQRSASAKAGELDDLISVVYRFDGRWHEVAMPCSADPGKYFLQHPINPNGTAIIRQGQYRGAYRRGLHKGRPALVQVAPVTVGRDCDKDEILEPGVQETGLFAINVHDDAGVGAEASAGCIVLPQRHLAVILELVAQQEKRWGETVTLTVLEVR